jgi:nucleotide-binding universal stress UspA family protein
MSHRHPSLAVVVGVDGTLNGLAATEVAVDEAVLRHLPLRIAYATPLGHPHSNVPRMPTSVTDLVLAVHQAHPELDITERIAPMMPSQLLLEEAENAALLVVGSPSHGDSADRAATCTAHIVLGAADCPVVVAQPMGCHDTWPGIS